MRKWRVIFPSIKIFSKLHVCVVYILSNVEKFEAELAMYTMIPENYLATGVVPICIRQIDDDGNRVFPGWIEAVPPVADPLRRLATRAGDVWLVSQLAEESVHGLSARHGADLGPAPSSAIYRDATWRALDMTVGGRRARNGLDVQLMSTVLSLVQEPYDFAKVVEDRELIEHLESKLIELGLGDAHKMLMLYLAEAEHEMPAAFGIESRKSTAWQTLCKRFRRGIDKALKMM
jgi:hypothetical protein